MWTLLSVGGEAANRLDNLVGVRQDKFLERRTESRVRVGGSKAAHRTVERNEGAFSDQRGDFTAEAPGQAILVDDEHLAGLARGGEDRVAIERQQRAQIEHFD